MRSKDESISGMVVDVVHLSMQSGSVSFGLWGVTLSIGSTNPYREAMKFEIKSSKFIYEFYPSS
jgi:hypothetical protein